VSKVFLSSTGKDLAEYREAAVEVCNRLQLVPIAMEYFEAMGAGATKGSKEKLDEADVYAGIFAHRYGYIEAGEEASVTEVEFDYAGERGIERLCFLVDARYPWPPDMVDYENYARVQALRQRVNQTVIRAEFKTVDDFRAKFLQALVEWQRRHGLSGGPQAPAEGKRKDAVVLAAPRASLMVGRGAEMAELKKRLGAAQDAVAQPLTIVRGWPGVGKTTLVTSLAYDKEVAAHFEDGMLWAALGEQADVPAELSSWAVRLGLPQREVAPLDRLIGMVRNALHGRRMLLIVDDVWQTRDAIPFKQAAGAGCSLLMTTRFSAIAQDLAGTPEDIYRLGVLSEEGALDLLRRLAPTVARDCSVEARELLEHIEYLPLAVRVAGRLLEAEARLGGDVRPLMQELKGSYRLLESVAPDDRFDARSGTTPTIQLLLERSTARLDEPTRQRFAMLGAFAPKPATFDFEAIRFVWETQDAMPTIRTLVDHGLLEPIPAEGRFQMHAILVMHARRLLEEM
jgi:hypothetical protein